MSKELRSSILGLAPDDKDFNYEYADRSYAYKSGFYDAQCLAAELASNYIAGAAKGGNTSDNITQAAANKAAEEGGLPEEGFLYGYFRKNGKHFDMLKGRPNVHTLNSGWVPLYTTKGAADRAARPVANKAEVEPIGYLAKWNGGTRSKLVSSKPCEWQLKEMGGPTDMTLTPLYATPPATTGASTVLTNEQLICKVARENGAPIAIVVARAIAREVAAQASQVAVPDDVADAKRYRWLRDTCYDTDPAGEGDAWGHPSLYFESSELEPYNSTSLDAAIDADMNTAPSPAKKSK